MFRNKNKAWPPLFALFLFLALYGGIYNSDVLAQVITIVSRPSPVVLKASCKPDQAEAFIGEKVIWRSTVSGGKAPYKYEWSGTENLSGAVSVLSKTYNEVGVKTAKVTITDSSGKNGVCVGFCKNGNDGVLGYYSPGAPDASTTVDCDSSIVIK